MSQAEVEAVVGNKRRRGRAPKTKKPEQKPEETYESLADSGENEDDSGSKGDEPEQKKGRGRPKKMEPEVNQSPKAPPSGKPRGRPKGTIKKRKPASPSKSLSSRSRGKPKASGKKSDEGTESSD